MPFDALVVFAKVPRPGYVKTRLAASLGAVPAAKLYGLFLRYLSWRLRKLPSGLRLFIAVDPPRGNRKISHYFPHMKPRIFAQKGRDLGARMINATREAKRRGANKVLLIGSDCLELKTAHLEKALRLLDKKGLALGKARDGGFYLIGWRSPFPALFHGVVWSTQGVFQKTALNAVKKGVSLGQLPVLSDLDRPGDLKRFLQRLDRKNPAALPLRKALGSDRHFPAASTE